MSGHSKWHNIQRTKNANDAVRNKVFTKISREIIVCIKEGGGDPSVNGKLRDLIAKAKSNNIPNDNINRLIQKAIGGDDKSNYEAFMYEGYGIGGIAVMVETLSDNKNRTAGNIRHYFDKYGGNLGTTGCVSYMFNQKGVVIANAPTTDEDVIMEDSIETDAEEYTVDTEEANVVRFEFAPADLHTALKKLEEKKYVIESYGLEYIPTTYTTLTDEEQIKKFEIMLEKLEEDDDVQNVYYNKE